MKRSLLSALVLVIAVAGSSLSAKDSFAVKWSAGKDVKAEICTFKYGKTFAYFVEIDDSPKEARTVVQPLLAKYHFTDAPPGVKGGKQKPFVGGIAVITITLDGGNNTRVNSDDLRFLYTNGWDILNHGYWSTGCHWDPKKKLSPDQFRREIYWTQQILGKEVWEGKKAPCALVYPNGDHNYGPYLKEFGILYGSSSGFGTPMDLTDMSKVNLLKIGRHNLDNGKFVKLSGPEDLVPEAPKEGAFMVDFTHKISKEGSDNYKLWQGRLGVIAKRFGVEGNDTIWSAPSSAVLRYRLNAAKAKLDLKKNSLKVTVPNDILGSPLTIKLTGLPESAKLKCSDKALIYRQGDTAWITTPMLGREGNPMPKEKLEVVYKGQIKPEITFPKPIKLAAIRVRQAGGLPKGYTPDLKLVNAGKETTLNMDKVYKWAPMSSRWGAWLLFPLLPEEKPQTVTSVKFANPEKSLKEIEVWAVVGERSTN